MGLFEQSLERLDWARKLTDIQNARFDALHHPELLTRATIPVRMDDGSTQFFSAWRCRYDTTRGPAKGGIRFHPGVDAQEVRSLAFWMTIKTALAGIPMGGGKGGVQVDARSLSEGELERLSRGYVRALFPVLGPDVDVPAPDVATNAQVMAWMVDEYEQIAGQKAPATFTGKPLARGGIEGRQGATALGAYHVLNTWLEHGGASDTLDVAIQGFGAAGAELARLLASDGHRVIAVSDSSGAILDRDGLDVEEVSQTKEREGSVTAFDGAESIEPEVLLALDVDLLVPAALELSITLDNVEDVRASNILEVANGPLSVDAEKQLDERGVTILPDVLVNAGGVIVSWMEWMQNRQGDVWPEDRVEKRLRERQVSNTREVIERAEEHSTSLRRAAYALALEALV